MPEIRMNSLKSLAMNCGPLSEMIRGRASGYFSLAACRMISMSASVNGGYRRIHHSEGPHHSLEHAALLGEWLRTEPGQELDQTGDDRAGVRSMYKPLPI
jgi:hypothetical protein